MNKLLFSILLLLFTSLTSFADPIDSLLQKEFITAKGLVEQQQYDEANLAFINLLTPYKVLPDEVCFYFGKSLFFTGHLKKSELFLEKYLTLKDTSDRHYDECVHILSLINPRKYAIKKTITPSESNTIDSTATSPVDLSSEKSEFANCNGHSHVICPVCAGTKVQVKQTNIGQVYSNCNYCNPQGFMKCIDYEKYLNGTLFDTTNEEKDNE